MKKNFLTTFLFSILAICQSFSQTSVKSGFTFSFDKVIEPSSSISQSFKNFEELSPSNNGGLNIPISLYNISALSGAGLPVSINYNATGIKVNQKSTDIGLGWNLNAGGSVQREVRGYPDDMFAVLVNVEAQRNIINPPNIYGEDHRFFTAVGYDYSHVYRDYLTSAIGKRELYKFNGLGFVDTKPDMFTVNLPNKSIRFIIKEGQAIPLEETDVEISIYRGEGRNETFWEISDDLILPTSYLRTNDQFTNGNGTFKFILTDLGIQWWKLTKSITPGDVNGIEEWEQQNNAIPKTIIRFPGEIKMFVVRDVDGTVYTLGTIQEAISDSRSTQGTWAQTVSGWQQDYPSSSYHGISRTVAPYRYSSSWDLSYICYPNSNETITFEYDQYYEINSSSNQNLNRSISYGDPNGAYQAAKLINTFSYQLLKYNRLKKIKWNNGYIDFNYSSTDRQDISNVLPFFKTGLDMNLRKEFDKNGNAFTKYANVSFSNGNVYSFCDEAFNIAVFYDRKVPAYLGNSDFSLWYKTIPGGSLRVSEQVQSAILELIDPNIPFKRNALEEILVNQNDNKQVRKITFHQSYFGKLSGSFDEKRLKLDKIAIQGSDLSKPEETKFEYDRPNEMPSVSSLEQDYWGYFNNNNALNLLPNIYYYPTRNIQTQYNGQVSILPYKYSQNTLGLGHVGSQNQNYYVLAPQQGTDVNGHYYKGYNRMADPNSMQIGMLIKVTYPTSGSRVFTYEPNEFKDYDNNVIQGGGLRTKKIETYGNGSIEAQLITTYNYINGKLIELPVFGYVNSLKLSDLGLSDWKEVLSTLFGGNHQHKVEALLTISSHPLNQFNNQTIGYDKVEIMSKKGKLVTSYLNPISYLDYTEVDNPYITNVSNYLFTLPYSETVGQESNYFPIKGLNPASPLPNYDWKIGLPLSTDVYMVDGTLAERTDYYYEIRRVNQHKGVSSATVASNSTQTQYNNVVSVPSTFKSAIYQELSHWLINTEQRKKVYENGQYNHYITRTEFGSTNHHMATKTTKIESNGTHINFYFKYPQDYDNKEVINPILYPDITPIGQLDKLNLVNRPIETVLTKTINGNEKVYDIKLMKYDYTLTGPTYSASLPIYDTDCTGELKVYPSKILKYIGGLKDYSTYIESSISSTGIFDYLVTDFESEATVEEVNDFGFPDEINKPLENKKIIHSFDYIPKTVQLDRELDGNLITTVQKTDFTKKAESIHSSLSQDDLSSSTSFEGLDREDWVYYTSAIVERKSPLANAHPGFSGNRCYQLNLANITYSGPSSSQNCILTFLTTSSNTNDFHFQGANITSHTVSSNNYFGYFLHTIKLSGVTTFTIIDNRPSNNNSYFFIDDLRLYSDEVYMVNTTVQPLIGITSKTDVNDQRQLFEYDEHHRLYIRRDNDGNIVESFKYNFKN